MSRHPNACDNSPCPICDFMQSTTESVVQLVADSDIFSGTFTILFLSETAQPNRTVWIFVTLFLIFCRVQDHKDSKKSIEYRQLPKRICLLFSSPPIQIDCSTFQHSQWSSYNPPSTVNTLNTSSAT